jgi:thiosulfate dehydrogenase
VDLHRSIRRCLVALAALGTLTMPLGVGGAQTGSQPNAAEITRQGNDRGAPACVSCHGPDLLGNPALGSPRLAGLSAPYLETQLDAFARGARKNTIMLPVATALSPAERHALAAYLSSLPARTASTPPDTTAARADSATVRAGEILATRGRWSSGIPACDRCHGPGGVGVGTAFPPLAGQPALYLRNQLDAWRTHTRAPGPLELMSTIAGRMSDADVSAVAAYYARQPVAPPAEGRRP